MIDDRRSRLCAAATMQWQRRIIAAGRIYSVMDEISLDEVPAGYERLHRGPVAGRLVAVIGR
jgi:hypothetical protein